MRPRGETATALLLLACKLSAAGRGVTFRELTDAGFGKDAVTTFLPALKRRGQLRITGTRQVSYRNKPVSVYEVVGVDPAVCEPEVASMTVLCNGITTWARQA